VIEEGARGRRTYSIAEKGRAGLRHWLLTPPDDFVVRNEFVLRLFLLSTLDFEAARALLHKVAEEYARQREALQAAVDQADRAAAAGAALPFNRLVAEFGLRSFQTIHDWAVWAIGTIDSARGASGQRPKLRAPSLRGTSTKHDSREEGDRATVRSQLQSTRRASASRSVRRRRKSAAAGRS
jgi:hypothetical protein